MLFEETQLARARTVLGFIWLLTADIKTSRWFRSAVFRAEATRADQRQSALTIDQLMPSAIAAKIRK